MAFRRALVATGAGIGMIMTGVSGSAHATPAAQHVDHVLLLSVDGLHQTDLTWFIAHNPHSALARLVDQSTNYTHAKTTFPSDSFPGMVAQLTGANPGTSGVYYDDTYNRKLLPPGTRDCTTATPGTEVSWTENIDRSQNPITLDAGQGLTAPALIALPTNTLAQTITSAPTITKAILAMTPTPQSLLDPNALPVDPATCTPVYPHDYLKVNTVFDVARAHGLRTAWSDKHAAYEILNGPSGSGIQDLFTPEINSVADATGDDWSTDNALTQVYDSIKVAAVVNEIHGYDHSGQHRVGTPAIFGMNFQTVSTAQKLPVSDGLTGGYDAEGNPGPLLTRALTYINTEAGRLETALRYSGHANDTAIILSAKHGQSPKNLATLRRVDDGAIIDSLDAAWTAAHPDAAALVSFSVDDDGMLLWLSDRHPAAIAFARHYLLTHRAPANLASDPADVYSTSVAASGLTRTYTGRGVGRLLGANIADGRTPDLVGIAQHGVVYTGGVKKIAEHGGDAPDDLDVPLVVDVPGSDQRTIAGSVQTAQIAPTILVLLGLNPAALQGVRLDHTAVLPGTRG